MFEPFDIFRSDAEGRLIWIEAAANSEWAKDRADSLSAKDHGDYWIVDHETGLRICKGKGTASKAAA